MGMSWNIFLAANLQSYQQWNMVHLSPCLYYPHYNNILKRHTPKLLYVINRASLGRQNYANYY